MDFKFLSKGLSYESKLVLGENSITVKLDTGASISTILINLLSNIMMCKEADIRKYLTLYEKESATVYGGNEIDVYYGYIRYIELCGNKLPRINVSLAISKSRYMLLGCNFIKACNTIKFGYDGSIVLSDYDYSKDEMLFTRKVNTIKLIELNNIIHFDNNVIDQNRSLNLF